MIRVVFVAGLIVLASGARVQDALQIKKAASNWDKPWFCHGALCLDVLLEASASIRCAHIMQAPRRPRLPQVRQREEHHIVQCGRTANGH